MLAAWEQHRHFSAFTCHRQVSSWKTSSIAKPSHEKAKNLGFRPGPTDIKRPVQSENQARGLQVRIYEEERLYYLCSENKDVDQLCSYCTAELHLCFRICRYVGFLERQLTLYSKNFNSNNSLVSFHSLTFFNSINT